MRRLCLEQLADLLLRLGAVIVVVVSLDVGRAEEGLGLVRVWHCESVSEWMGELKVVNVE